MTVELRPGDVVTLRDWDQVAKLTFGKRVAPLVVGKVMSVDEARQVVHFWADHRVDSHGTLHWSKQRTLPLGNVVERESRASNRLRSDVAALAARGEEES